MIEYRTAGNRHLRQPVGEEGFTLIEVIVVLAIIAIAATIAIPNFKGFLDRSNVTSAANDMVSALNLARSEAVTRGTNVTVCKSANPGAVSASCTTAGSWAQGWIVFTDSDGDAVVDVGDGDTVLRVYSGSTGATTIVGNGSVANRLTYANTGFFTGVFNGTITVTSGSRVIQIITSSTGRIRTQ